MNLTEFKPGLRVLRTRAHPMRCITEFKIVDLGVQRDMACLRGRFYDRMVANGYNGFVSGVGTDAESALDDMFQLLDDYDVAGLEGEIKSRWNPSDEEGNGCDLWYHFGIVFRSI
jgi:hypothetical protein